MTTPSNRSTRLVARRRLPFFLALVAIVMIFQTGSRARAGNDAEFVVQSVPTQVVAGHTYAVSVTMRNTGTTTWDSTTPDPPLSHAYHFRNQSITSATWMPSRVGMPHHVAPGETVTFDFTITAPTTPGVYDFRFRMVEELVEFFGETSEPLSINVVASRPNDSAFVSQLVPGAMVAGQLYPDHDQDAEHRDRALVCGRQPQAWISRILTTTRYSVSVAPSSPRPRRSQCRGLSIHGARAVDAGTYNFQWRMLQENVESLRQLHTERVGRSARRCRRAGAGRRHRRHQSSLRCAQPSGRCGRVDGDRTFPER